MENILDQNGRVSVEWGVGKFVWGWGVGIQTAMQGKVVDYVKSGKCVCSEIRCVTMECYPQHMRDVSWDSSVNIVTG